MTGATNGGGGGKSGEGVQHGAMGTMGWSHTGVVGWPQTNGGPHWNADAGEAERTAVKIKRSKQANNRATMTSSWINIY
jgi:hypothetical protein